MINADRIIDKNVKDEGPSFVKTFVTVNELTLYESDSGCFYIPYESSLMITGYSEAEGRFTAKGTINIVTTEQKGPFSVHGSLSVYNVSGTITGDGLNISANDLKYHFLNNTPIKYKSYMSESSSRAEMQNNIQSTYDGTVWISEDGTRYHSYSSCSGMVHGFEVSRSTAIARGYSACSRCW